MLTTADPSEKVERAHAAASAWRSGRLGPPRAGDRGDPPDRPARPDRPPLAPPGEVPRRRLGQAAGRVALLHAVAHIEFNAIDLAFDLLCRFAGATDIDDAARADFVSDWITVGDDEARHFTSVCARLADFGASYGDLPAHDGLWQAALATADDLGARLAIAPLVLEARGLDVTPGMIARLRKAGDGDSAAVLEVIYAEEVGHVSAGARWFEHICRARGADPQAAFRDYVATRFVGGLKEPFNVKARRAAGMPQSWYA